MIIMKKGPNGRTNIIKNVSRNGFLPCSFKFISSCIKTVSCNVRSAGASVAGSFYGDSSDDDRLKDQVLWAGFDRLEFSTYLVKQVLLIGYSNGFQVLNVEDASSVCELVSRRDDPVTFLQIQPFPAKSDSFEGFRKSHPMLVVVASNDKADAGLLRDGFMEPHAGNLANSATTVRFYSFVSNTYVHFLRFRSTVYMVRCSPQIVAVGLAAQIYCFDALTLENKFSVLTYPVPQLGGQGLTGVNIGYGPMAVGPRWLAYASNNPLLSNAGRLSPQSLTLSPCVSPSTSPSNGNLVAKYAMESSKHLAAGLINLGGTGFKTFSKAGRVATQSAEMDAAGMVIIKDFTSGAIISQFRAHTSPISALCFDPSGTLLVTASVHGNNINIFRILPSSLQNGSGSRHYDWSSSHVHMYKLHRGMTSAVIQDICFSTYSQWIAITSSRGTCHVFLLSPFGGETGLQFVTSHADGPTLLPVLSMPWWSTSSFLKNQRFPPPPATLTLSVVSRIKGGGWLTTVGNAASSAEGKILVPSGVVAAVFYNSLLQNMLSASLSSSAMEHLLVYSPSGHLIQYEFLPLLGREQGESSLRNGSGSLLQMQEDELQVKVEPVQWWDVCRRAYWPEREESIKGMTHGRRERVDPVMGTSSCCDNEPEGKDHMRPLDRSRWYLSSAEVQLRSGRIPIWQKSKIYFHKMALHGREELNPSEVQIGGEIEIEKIPVCEIDAKRKDLLPISDHFHRIHPAWGDDRKQIASGFTASTTSSHNSMEAEDSVASETNSISIGLIEKPHANKKSSDGSLTTSASLHDNDEKGMLASFSQINLSLDQNDGIRSSSSILASPLLRQRSFSRIGSSAFPDSSANILSYVEESYVVNSPNSLQHAWPTEDPGTPQIQPSRGVATNGISGLNTNQSDTSMKFNDKGQVCEDMHHRIGFGQYFQEGYCSVSTSGEPHDLAEGVADIDRSTGPGDKEKSEEYEQSDDMPGGIFPFSEEG